MALPFPACISSSKTALSCQRTRTKPAHEGPCNPAHKARSTLVAVGNQNQKPGQTSARRSFSRFNSSCQTAHNQTLAVIYEHCCPALLCSFQLLLDLNSATVCFLGAGSLTAGVVRVQALQPRPPSRKLGSAPQQIRSSQLFGMLSAICRSLSSQAQSMIFHRQSQLKGKASASCSDLNGHHTMF